MFCEIGHFSTNSAHISGKADRIFNHENFITGVSLDKEVHIKFWKSSGSWGRITTPDWDCRSRPDFALAEVCALRVLSFQLMLSDISLYLSWAVTCWTKSNISVNVTWLGCRHAAKQTAIAIKLWRKAMEVGNNLYIRQYTHIMLYPTDKQMFLYLHSPTVQVCICACMYSVHVRRHVQIVWMSWPFLDVSAITFDVCRSLYCKQLIKFDVYEITIVRACRYYSLISLFICC